MILYVLMSAAFALSIHLVCALIRQRRSARQEIKAAQSTVALRAGARANTNPSFPDCAFCALRPVGTNPGYHSIVFCSQWCENYWNLNGGKPCTTCDECGWRGAKQDFAVARNEDLVGVGGRPPSDYVLHLCMNCVPKSHLAVTDEEFEAYRAKILEDL